MYMYMHRVLVMEKIFWLVFFIAYISVDLRLGQQKKKVFQAQQQH